MFEDTSDIESAVIDKTPVESVTSEETTITNDVEEEKFINFKDSYQRILSVLKIKTQAQLADVLNIRQSSISDAKKRNVIPDNWLIKLFDTHRLNPDWIRWGEGNTFLG